MYFIEKNCLGILGNRIQARPKKYIIPLTDEQLKDMKSVIRKKQTSKTVCIRSQIIIDLDEAHGKILTHEQSAKSNGVCMATNRAHTCNVQPKHP